MTTTLASLNEPLGWAALLLGLCAGALLGLRFDDESWLGGYAAPRRRLLRLGHVALVALGALNVLFARAAATTSLSDGAHAVASAALLLGAASMPAACVAMAFRPRSKPLFALPIASLLLGVGLAALGSLPS